MGNDFFFRWEITLMEWLQAGTEGFGTSVAAFASMFGEELFLIAILGFLYWCWDKECGKLSALSMLTSQVWNPMIKNLFLRNRPYVGNPSITCRRPVEPDYDIFDMNAQGYSFPSGHATNIVGTFGSIALYLKKRRVTILAVVLALAVGISRCVLGVHYPTDVLAGWALGLVSILLVRWMWLRLPRGLMYAVVLLSGLPGLLYCTSADYYTAYGLLTGLTVGSVFEARYVHFSGTRSPIRCILRVLGGIAVYFVFNTLLKLPFSSDFLDSGSFAANLIRLGRYSIVSFLLYGVYPMIFRFTAEIGRNRKPAAGMR